MGFFHISQRAVTSPTEGLPIDVLHRKECQVCPLNRLKDLKNPHMQPAGTDKPLVYMLGEAPGGTEDAKGVPFVGKAGRVLRFRIPADWDDHLRWSNVVRTRPPDNRTPTQMEIECCRPSVERDIEATKPVAIFGFGAVPLKWALNQSTITQWNGRRIPIKVRSHLCWFYPMLHPSYVMRNRRFTPRKTSEYGSDDEFVFAVNLKNAFAEVETGLPDPVVHTREDAERGIEYVTGSGGDRDLEKVRDFIEDLNETDLIVGYDYETNAKRPYVEDAKILSLALSARGRTLAFPLDHPESEWTREQRKALDDIIYQFLMESRCRKVSHYLSFEMEWTAFFFGKKTLRAQKWGDTVAQAFILDERPGKGRPGALSLEFLCLQYFGINMKQLSNLDRKKLETTALDVVLQYNAIDASYHEQLYVVQRARLKKEGLVAVYQHHLRRVPAVVLTQMRGMPVDQERVEKFYRRFKKELKETEKAIAELKVVKRFRESFGHPFRPSANPDILRAFNDLLHKNLETTDENHISEIDHPLAKLVIEWRKANKKLSTYVLPLREGSETLFPDGKLHPILSLTKVETWRTSSEDPNSQNFPKRKDKYIRSQIKGSGEQKIVSFDYGQIQARNVGMESLDPKLLKYFWERHDMHAEWTERLAQLYPQWVEGGVKMLKDKKVFKVCRDLVKNQFVFPCFFGAVPKSQARYLGGIPEWVTEKMQEEFWDKFPFIKDWQKRILADYDRLGYVQGLSGFRRRAPITRNQLINAPIQADEAIIVLDAMARLSELDHVKYQANMEIHDDLTFVWPKKEIEKRAEIVIHEMIHVPFKWAHTVPIVIEMSVGDDWSSGEEVGVFASDDWDGVVGYDKKVDEWIDEARKKKIEAEKVGTGSWDDGTGWANDKKYEKAPSHLRRKRWSDRRVERDE